MACEARGLGEPGGTVVGVPAGIRARWGGGQSCVRSAELLDTWSTGLVLPSSLGLRKEAWPSSKWEESRTRVNAHTCPLAETGPGCVFAMRIIVLKTMQLRLPSFQGSVIIYVFNSQSSYVKATENQFLDIKRLWKSTTNE